MENDTIICSPFEEPSRHFQEEKDRSNERICAGRRKSFYRVRSSQPVQARQQQERQQELYAGEIHDHELINAARRYLSEWRKEAYFSLLTKTTQRLLRHWQDTQHEPRLFFCQIEALETAIYLNEVEAIERRGRKHSMHGQSLMSRLTDVQEAQSSLFRIAFKMATGAGKTLVMGMLVAYHFLNRRRAPNDRRFAESFLVVAPNLTIRDRLEVLMPNGRDNYYEKHSLVPRDMMAEMRQASVVVTNFHALARKKTEKMSEIVRKKAGIREDAFDENAADMVKRVCGGLRGDILVLNDEAHHCYRHKEGGAEDAVEGQENKEESKQESKEERKDAEKQKERAQIWLRGLEAIKEERGMRLVYDLSATPFFLKGSGRREGEIFPWVISDFSLHEAIESGIVKVPRVPLASDNPDDSYRYFWHKIRAGLLSRSKRRGRGDVASSGSSLPFPAGLQVPLLALYGEYEKVYKAWFQDEQRARQRGDIPPVFIVVCQNTDISRLVRDHIAGYRREDGRWVEGKFPLFSNREELWTLLVDSREMENSEGLLPTFKREAQEQIALLDKKRADKVDHEEVLRKVMNTVGKRGELGAKVRCVVSVSMLTEGWDANNVTHVLGVRAFSTQLLCEQVVGRALRRTSYAKKTRTINWEDGKGDDKTEEIETFTPEYADIYGVPFDHYFPVAPIPTDPPQVPETTRVSSLAERADYEIRFPCVEGYVRTFEPMSLKAAFTRSSRYDLTGITIPVRLRVRELVGSGNMREVELVELMKYSEEVVVYTLAHGLLQRFKAGELTAYGDRVEAWRFPDLLRIVRLWIRGWVVWSKEHFLPLLMVEEYRAEAIDKIFTAVGQPEERGSFVAASMEVYREQHSTTDIAFDTAKEVMATGKSHLSHVVLDRPTHWEHKLAERLEEMDEVLSYVKNDIHLQFKIPYEHLGRERSYFPDFVAYIDDGGGMEDPLKLIVEVSGGGTEQGAERGAGRGKENLAVKAKKVETVRTMWLPAVNRLRRFGRWDFIELRDAKRFKGELLAFLAQRTT